MEVSITFKRVMEFNMRIQVTEKELEDLKDQIDYDDNISENSEKDLYNLLDAASSTADIIDASNEFISVQID